MGIEWHINNSGRIIKAVIPKSDQETETIRIPSEIDGKSVTILGTSLFEANTFIKTVIMPASVKFIGASAFKSCRNLETVIFEENSQLEIIGESAFSSCNIKDFPFAVLHKLQKISENAFTSNWHLGVVDLSNSEITLLKSGCFADTGVTEIYFSKTIHTFGRYCLGNTKLRKLDFSNLECSPIIYYEAFKNNPFLEEIIFPKVPMQLGIESFGSCPSLKKLSIPPYVDLAEYCFLCCSGLEKVIFEEGHSSTRIIHDGAFKQCSMLKTVQIDTDFTTIGQAAFSECESLQTISFPKTLTEIRKYAFWRCAKIQSVDLTQTDIQNVGLASFAFTNFNLCDFKIAYTSGVTIEKEAFKDNIHISNSGLTTKYPFCYIPAD